MSRRIVRSRNGSSSVSVAERNLRRKRSSSISATRARMSASDRSRISSALIGVRLLLRNELRLQPDLRRRQRHCLLGDVARHALELEHHATRTDDGHPPFRRALALPHTRFRRLLGDRLVREDPDPDLPATLDVARQRDPRRLDLAVRDPPGLQRLQPVVAERDLGTTRGQAARATLEHLSKFYSLRTKHWFLSCAQHSAADG